MRKRSDKRMESYRERKSKEYGNKEKKRIFDELMFGYRSQNEVMKSLQIITVPKSIVVSVTTRAVGFMCQFLFCKFARLNVKFPLGNNGLPAVPNQSSPSRNKTGPSDVRTVFALHWKITFLAIRSDAGTCTRRIYIRCAFLATRESCKCHWYNQGIRDSIHTTTARCENRQWKCPWANDCIILNFENNRLQASGCHNPKSWAWLFLSTLRIIRRNMELCEKIERRWDFRGYPGYSSHTAESWWFHAS